MAYTLFQMVCEHKDHNEVERMQGRWNSNTFDGPDVWHQIMIAPANAVGVWNDFQPLMDGRFFVKNLSRTDQVILSFATNAGGLEQVVIEPECFVIMTDLDPSVFPTGVPLFWTSYHLQSATANDVECEIVMIGEPWLEGQ